MPDDLSSSRRAYLKRTAAAATALTASSGLSAASHDPDPSNLRLYMDMWPGSGVTAEDQDYIVSADDQDVAHSSYYNETGTSVTNGGDRVSHDSDTAEWRGTLDSSDDVRDIYYHDGKIYTYYVYKSINFEAVENAGSFDVNTYQGFTIDGYADYTVWTAADVEPYEGNNMDGDEYTGVDSTGGYFGGRVDGDNDTFYGYGDIKRVEVDVDSNSYFRIRVG
jgi:hypothetical protein